MFTYSFKLPFMFFLCFLALSSPLLGSHAHTGFAKGEYAAEGTLSAKKADRREKRMLKRQKRGLRGFEKLRSRLKSCDCGGALEEARAQGEPARYSEEVQKSVMGAFLLLLGGAALYALFIISLSGFILPKLLAIISIFVGDSLLCRNANICILRVFFDIFSFIAWF